MIPLTDDNLCETMTPPQLLSADLLAMDRLGSPNCAASERLLDAVNEYQTLHSDEELGELMNDTIGL